MINNYISYYKLPSLPQLTQQRFSSINSLINSLKFKDVEENETFEATKKRIKKSVLFEPIIFGDPKFIDFEHLERPVRLEQQFFGHVGKDKYIHEIEFPFTGDNELFEYTSDGTTIHSSDHGIIFPTGNKLTVYVELPEISPDKSILGANPLLRLTKEIVERNNSSIILWNAAIEKKLDEELEVKRDELFRIFGKKK